MSTPLGVLFGSNMIDSKILFYVIIIFTTMFNLSIDPKYRQYSLILGVFLLGVTIGLILHQHPPALTKDVRSNESKYHFINPLLECENASFENQANLAELQRKIEERINEGKNKGAVRQVSVYFRDLNNGPWFGINENEKFSPASLIKVPVMIAYFKLAETNPEILDKQITVTQDVMYENQNFVPAEKLVKGQSYSVRALIERMIVDSDNYAYDLLLDQIDNQLIIHIYNEIGIDIQKLNQDDPDGNIINVKSYAGFFRILFNSSYLSEKYSEEALSLLSRSSFKNGLIAGAPPGTTISHKFGERFYNFSGVRQLHDCGIVYHPKRPYLLCVMTQGTEFSTLSETIRDISKMIYDANLEESE